MWKEKIVVKNNPKKNILIIGIAGGLAQITAKLLTKKYPDATIIGVDSREFDSSDLDKNITIQQMQFSRSNFEKLFREHKFDVVYHLARMSHIGALPGANLTKRLDLNLMGTQRILDLSLKFSIKKIIILSTFHVYGALSDNPVFINEDYPLRASIKYPELRDVVEMDQICTTWMWKNQKEIETIILRPCNIIGAQINNTMTRYLTTPYVPMCMDFNPLMQFIHEFDIGNILSQASDKLPLGIYNVAPDECISIKDAKKVLNISSSPVPSFLLEGLTKLISTPIWKFPHYLIDYIKFACIIDNKLIKEHLGEDLLRYNQKETLELLEL